MAAQRQPAGVTTTGAAADNYVRKAHQHTWQARHGGTHSCKIYKPLPKQELINRLSGKHPRTPLTQISSVATHRSDAKLSTIIHDRALFLCASLVPQDHAILRNLPYER